MNRLRAEEGFTLIELLVVIAIIGILAAMALPQFAAYRRRAYDSDVKSNVKNASIAQEAYFTHKQTYSSALGDLASWGFKQSTRVDIALAATETDFVITGTSTIGCSASTGAWSFASTIGAITGAPCN